jgi:hypothetical protein
MSEKQDHWERYWSGRVCEQPEGPSQDADAFAGSHPRWNRLTRCFDHSAPFKVVWMDADGEIEAGWYTVEPSVRMLPDGTALEGECLDGPFDTSQDAYDEARGN